MQVCWAILSQLAKHDGTAEQQPRDAVLLQKLCCRSVAQVVTPALDDLQMQTASTHAWQLYVVSARVVMYTTPARLSTPSLQRCTELDVTEQWQTQPHGCRASELACSAYLVGANYAVQCIIPGLTCFLPAAKVSIHIPKLICGFHLQPHRCHSMIHIFMAADRSHMHRCAGGGQQASWHIWFRQTNGQAGVARFCMSSMRVQQLMSATALKSVSVNEADL